MAVDSTGNQRQTAKPRIRRRSVLACGARGLALLAVVGLGVGLASPRAAAGEVRVAVASGFAAPARDIARRFSAHSGHNVTLAFGASGRLYARIVGGDVFQVFISADRERPAKAAAADLIVPDSRVVLADGGLVLWSADPTLVDDAGRVLRRTGALESLATPNPVTSPHGAAAMATLEALGVADRLRDTLSVRDTVAAVADAVASGAAKAGFLSVAAVPAPPRAGAGGAAGSAWRVPASLHPPLTHEAVLLASGARSDAARAFMAFLKHEEAREIMRRYGYVVPGVPGTDDGGPDAAGPTASPPAPPPGRKPWVVR